MKSFAFNEQAIKRLKEEYPIGTRVQLDHMEDDPHPIPDKTMGTVVFVDDIGTLHCKFVNGRSLGICPEVDRFHKLAPLNGSDHDE